MGLIRCVLKHKQSELNLNDPSGRFHIARDFVPPPVSISPNISVGTSANRMDGGQLVSMKAENRRWSFGVHVTGDSEAEVRGGISLLDSFLRRGTPSDPVYVHVRGSEDVSFEPLWGQYGSDLRYEIIFGIASASRQYSFGFIREGELPECQVSLEIKPFALGLQQRLGSATGGILEDTIGVTDGISRGVIIPEALDANKFTNPIFGHATYNSGWSVTGTLIVSENTDSQFITHGKSSVKLTNPEGATDRTLYQTLDVGNTNSHVISCYAKRPDGGAVTSADGQLFYGTMKTTTYESVGDGWYRLRADVTGIAAGTFSGITVKKLYSLYADGFQIEEKAYITPLCHGDMLGCSWSGTAHASTSVRVAARLMVDAGDSIDPAEGTIRVVWKAPISDDDYSANAYLWTSEASSVAKLRGVFLSASDSWEFHDGTNSVAGVTSFSPGDMIILHFIFRPGELNIYVNGSSIASGVTYTPSDLDGDVYIGTDNSGASHIGGTFMDFTTFAQAMSATEVSDDYDNILEHVEDDQRLSPIPWLWTKDGDDVVDNCDDSTRDNWAIVGGIPGSAPAITQIIGDLSSVFGTIKSFFMNCLNFPADRFLRPAIISWGEISGTVDAACSGGEYLQTSIDTTRTRLQFSPGTTYALQAFYLLEGREFILFTRLYDAGSDLQIGSSFHFDTVAPLYETDMIDVSTTTAFRLLKTSSLSVFDMSRLIVESGLVEPNNLVFGLELERTTGSDNVRVDYIDLLFRPVMKFVGTGSYERFSYSSREHSGVIANELTDRIMNPAYITGDQIEFYPEDWNMINVLMAEIEDNDPVITYTMTFINARVMPRWALL